MDEPPACHDQNKAGAKVRIDAKSILINKLRPVIYASIDCQAGRGAGEAVRPVAIVAGSQPICNDSSSLYSRARETHEFEPEMDWRS